MRFRLTVLSFLTVIALAGCNVLPRHAPPQRYHDFGAAATTASLPRVSIGLGGVTAPPWLSGDAILYRFLSRDPTRLRAYGRNRWVAPPADLLAQAVRERLPPDGRPRYRLQLRLERFEQDFVAADRSMAIIRVRAVLITQDGTVRAERVFQLSRATSPDVHGGIHGLSSLGNRAAQDIEEWAVRHARDTPRPP